MDLERFPAQAAEEPVARRVYRELRAAIVTLRLQPGAPLSEVAMAQSLGVSRQPVREAFIKLAESGLVQVRPQRGTFVARISAKSVEVARFVRTAIEVEIARRAAAAGNAALVEAARRALEGQETAVAANDTARFLALDDAFHLALAEGVGLEGAWRVIEDVKAQMDRVRYLSLPAATPLARLLEQHRAILDAVAAAAPGRAAAAMTTHLEELVVSLPQLAAAHPDLFEAAPE